MLLTIDHVPGVENAAADALSRDNYDSFRLQMPSAHACPTPIPEELVQLLVHQRPYWTSKNWTALRPFFCKRFSPLRSAPNRFLKFCKDGNFRPIPMSEVLLCRYVSFLANQGLKHRTVKAYLSAVQVYGHCRGRSRPVSIAIS